MARFGAIKALEKLSDPAQDINLIMRYIDVIWQTMGAHCPCCHEDFPLAKIRNAKLDEYRTDNSIVPVSPIDSDFDRRLYLIGEAERTRHPHKSQLIALGAPERTIIGKGAARGGKSFLLAMFGLMFLLIPGVEVWILARTFKMAEKEFGYIEGFLQTLFYPVHNHMYQKSLDTKSGEGLIKARWGSEIRIKSGKAIGSITASELEAALVAEPAWVDGELFEELRARMSSRLGRIIALGTPKGFGGFLGRLVKMGSRDMRTGRKLAPEERLVSGGCPWENSILIYNMNPTDNPQYVKSELESARGELTREEFAAEFEGLMVSGEMSKFPFIKEDHLKKIDREEIHDCVFVEGVDQGTTNFGACTVGWNGKTAYVFREYLDTDKNTTIRTNLVNLNHQIPADIRLSGGSDQNWKLTIFDADPNITGELSEMAESGNKWKTDITYRPKNLKDFTNWREETCIFVNQLASEGNLWFDSEYADQLHEQLMEVLNKPKPEGKDTGQGSNKGWVINDRWRGEHVPDAFMLAMFTIMTEQIQPEIETTEPKDACAEAEAAQRFLRARDEARELQGFPGHGRVNEEEIFQREFGRPRRSFDSTFFGGMPGNYPDES